VITVAVSSSPFQAHQPRDSLNVRGPFEKFVNSRQCAAVMQREAVIVMPSYCGGGNLVVA
jgi:hypothetical protein